MDTSKKNIKMCEKAEEIQKLADRYIDKWSFFYCKEHDRLNQWSIDDEAYYCLGWKQLHKLTIQSHRLNFQRLSKNSIWLPRQDQLQEMLTGNGLDGTYVSATSPQGNTNYKYGFTEILLRRCLLNKFHQWCNDYDYSVKFRYLKPFDIFESMEQLWLAFVMHQKKKVWNGEAWVHD